MNLCVSGVKRVLLERALILLRGIKMSRQARPIPNGLNENYGSSWLNLCNQVGRPNP